MGMLVSYNVVTGPPSSDLFTEMRALLGRSLALRTFSMHTFDEVPLQRRALMQEAVDLLTSRQVKAPAAHVLKLADIASRTSCWTRAPAWARSCWCLERRDLPTAVCHGRLRRSR